MTFTNTDRLRCNQEYWHMTEHGQLCKYVNCKVRDQVNGLSEDIVNQIIPIQIKIKEKITL